MFSTPARVPTIEGRVMGCRTWTKVRPIAAASVRADDSIGFIFIASLMLHVLSKRKIPPPPGKPPLCTLFLLRSFTIERQEMKRRSEPRPRSFNVPPTKSSVEFYTFSVTRLLLLFLQQRKKRALRWKSSVKFHPVDCYLPVRLHFSPLFFPSYSTQEFKLKKMVSVSVSFISYYFLTLPLFFLSFPFQRRVRSFFLNDRLYKDVWNTNAIWQCIYPSISNASEVEEELARKWSRKENNRIKRILHPVSNRFEIRRLTARKSSIQFLISYSFSNRKNHAMWKIYMETTPAIDKCDRGKKRRKKKKKRK